MAEIRTEDIFGSDSLKPNSNRSKEHQEDIPEKVEKLSPVVSGKTRKQEKNFAKRILTAFIDENPDGVIGNDPNSIKVSIFKVVIPETKKLILDIANAIMYRGKSPYSRKSNTSRITYTSYGDYHDPDRYSRREAERPRAPLTARDYGDVIYDNRGDAERVLSCMEEIIAARGVVTVAQFYDLSHIDDDVSWTSCNFGWIDISSAKVIRVGRDEYSLSLPKAMPLD